MTDLDPGQYTRYREEEDLEAMPVEAKQAARATVAASKRAYVLRTKIDEPEAEWIVLRIPTRAEYSRFMEAIDSSVKDQKTASHRNLALAVSTYPARAELAALFDDFPGLAFTIANTAIKISGFGDATASKK